MTQTNQAPTLEQQQKEVTKMITGKERYEAISDAEEHLAKGLSHTSAEENKEALIELNIAMRSYGKAITQMNELVSLMMADTVQNYRMLQESQEAVVQIDHQLKTVLVLLQEEGIADEQKLEKIYKEKIIPAYMEHLKRIKEEGNSKEKEEGN